MVDPTAIGRDGARSNERSGRASANDQAPAAASDATLPSLASTCASSSSSTDCPGRGTIGSPAMPRTRSKASWIADPVSTGPCAVA